MTYANNDGQHKSLTIEQLQTMVDNRKTLCEIADSIGPKHTQPVPEPYLIYAEYFFGQSGLHAGTTIIEAVKKACEQREVTTPSAALLGIRVYEHPLWPPDFGFFLCGNGNVIPIVVESEGENNEH